jgi:putative nucleotidyltransferase with HDIG domain
MLELNAVVRAITDLPSLPEVTAQLLTDLNREDLSVHWLANRICLDQALAAKTLRLANSSFYGLPSAVESVQQAVVILGLSNVRTLVTACALAGSFPAPAVPGFDFQGFWRHSIGTAVCARMLAPRLKVSPDSGFTAGLLHDLGELALCSRYPDKYAEVLAYRKHRDCTLREAERALLGLDHAEVGARLAAHWKFPPPVCDAVGEHHGSGAAHGGLAGLLAVASLLAHALDPSSGADEQVPPLPAAMWERLGLDEGSSAELFAAIERNYKELCAVLVH